MIPPEILEDYDIKDCKIERMKGGIVNESYKVSAKDKTMVLQKLNKIFDRRVVEDYCRLLKNTSIKFIPQIVKIKEGKDYLTYQGHIWRAYNYIEHDGMDYKENEMILAAKKLAEFHDAIKHLDIVLNFSIENFHNTEATINKLQITFKNNKEKSKNVEDQYNFIFSEVKKHFLGDVKRQLIHGDPKIENFMFKDGKVVGLIDFDTLMYAPRLIDLGDAFRSWCENKNKFDKKIFDVVIKAYNENSSEKYSEEEVIKAVKLITLELASRFLEDYFDGSYFLWDPEKYKSSAEHNLKRCNDLITYYKSI